MRSIWSLLHLLNRWTIQLLIHASFFRSFLHPFMDWFNQSSIQSVVHWSFRWHFNSRLHMCYCASQPQHWIPCILTGVLMTHWLLLTFNPCFFETSAPSWPGTIWNMDRTMKPIKTTNQYIKLTLKIAVGVMDKTSFLFSISCCF